MCVREASRNAHSPSHHMPECSPLDARSQHTHTPYECKWVQISECFCFGLGYSIRVPACSSHKHSSIEVDKKFVLWPFNCFAKFEAIMLSLLPLQLIRFVPFYSFLFFIFSLGTHSAQRTNKQMNGKWQNTCIGCGIGIDWVCGKIAGRPRSLWFEFK